MSKPREFWINPKANCERGETCWMNEPFEAYGEEVFHVIEKSAFDELNLENKRLKEKIDMYEMEIAILRDADIPFYKSFDNRQWAIQLLARGKGMK